MANPKEVERQREHRQRVLKGATILRTVSDSEIQCMVRNIHVHGAELKIPPATSIPREFLLYVPADKIAYRSTLRWRHGDRAGVSFSGTEPKPHWHYG